MSDQLRKLIDDQNRTWNRMQEITRSADAEGWNAELRANYDDAEKHLDEVSGDIERLDRAGKLADKVDYREPVDARVPAEERAAETPEERGAAYEEAFHAYLRHGMSELPTEQKQVLRSGFVKNENRAGELQTTPGSQGGFLVPEGFRAVITEAMKAFGGLLNHANVITTSTGNNLPWPTNDDTSNVGALLAENTQIAPQHLVFGEKELGAFTYTSKLVLVSWQLLNDSAFDLPNFVARKCGERIGRIWATHLVSGSGSSQPTGLVSAATVGVTGADSALPAITYDNLIDLEHSVDPAYRGSNRVRYVMSDGALKLIRKLKDADGRPLWVPVPAPGFAPSINGYSYTVDNSMAAPAAGGRSVIFGDIAAGYIVRQVQGIQMVRLDERYADFLQSGFFAFARMDADVDDANAVKAFVHGAESST